MICTNISYFFVSATLTSHFAPVRSIGILRYCHVTKVFAEAFLCGIESYVILFLLCGSAAGNTRGLLGTLDGDATNDFTTRDGVVLPVVSFNDSNGEQAEFGDSCECFSS